MAAKTTINTPLFDPFCGLGAAMSEPFMLLIFAASNLIHLLVGYSLPRRKRFKWPRIWFRWGKRSLALGHPDASNDNKIVGGNAELHYNPEKKHTAIKKNPKKKSGK